jgi:hypothetical protein
MHRIGRMRRIAPNAGTEAARHGPCVNGNGLGKLRVPRPFPFKIPARGVMRASRPGSDLRNGSNLRLVFRLLP